ncbi:MULTISPECIES: MarR family winged helix-turn-helix transcriptional regulator [unclassified Crossiella]|uniref:MarR family winged helix-turn-helix transcriptional regulator n=1 Tax=unclassified Crossiella TaxID=2620835 RepID=UPI001FFF9DFA|nr:MULTISPECIES: MarR family transcriptional regulator [unclassified Crossiella]MCK2244263.1 MarR family transcriptional regulator [Crossiella sp. S99.2]MCK2258067.1 MarR family transcriptional regulator [Crossiella sp. S99.1]
MATTDGTPLTLYLIKRLELVSRSLLDDALRPRGLTTLQYTALTVLEARGATSSAQLARRSFLRPQTMHEMVLTLEKRGLIRREAQPGNKRVLLATLTEAGQELLAECRPAVLELERAMLEQFSPGQRAVFREALELGIGSLAPLARERESTDGGRD